MGSVYAIINRGGNPSPLTLRKEKKMSKGLTVNELLIELQDLVDNGDGDKEIYFGCDYGDYCHTEQALPIKYVEEGTLRDSAYSHSGKAFESNDEDDFDEDSEEKETVIKFC